MAKELDKRQVKRWLWDQKVAARRIEEEKTDFLLRLTPEESLRIYLSLPRHDVRENPAEPSPLLWAMRQAMRRLESKRKKG